MELLSELGLDPNDGVLLAYLPDLGHLLQEDEVRAHPKDLTVYSLDGIVLDMLPSGKWWKVREAARQLGMSTVEPIWSGAFSDFRVPDVPRPEGAKLFVRAFSNGPWVCLERDNEVCLETEKKEEAKHANSDEPC